MTNSVALWPPSETMRALVLDGAGFEHLQVRDVAVPAPGPAQILARVDAAGICSPLIKLIEQGPIHKFMYDGISSLIP